MELRKVLVFLYFLCHQTSLLAEISEWCHLRPLDAAEPVVSFKPVFGKFCMMDGVIGLSGLGAGVPCIYETRDSELPGSSSWRHYPLLTPSGACNVAQAL